MHILQPKHIKLKPEEAKIILAKYNISLSQLPKIKHSDPALPSGCQPRDLVKIERRFGDRISIYYRAVA